MTEMMMILSVVSFLTAGVFAMTSVVLWIRFDIPGIVGELRGGPAKREPRSEKKAGEEAAINDRRERGGRKERVWTEQETERLDRGHLCGKETRGRSGSAEDVMIIHTDERI